jgi:hypothetical protein
MKTIQGNTNKTKEDAVALAQVLYDIYRDKQESIEEDQGQDDEEISKEKD